MDAQIFIKGEIGNRKLEDGTVQQGVTLIDVVTQFQAQKGASRYVINVDSPGGNVHEANQITRFLKGMQETHELIAVGSEVASAATKIFLVVNKRSANPDFSFMAHNPSMLNISGDAEMLEDYAKFAKGLEKEFEDFYAEVLGISAETVSDLMDTETTIGLDQARTLGIINHEYIELSSEVNIIAIKSNVKSKKEKMNLDDKKWFEDKLNGIAKLFKKKAVSLTIMTKEGVEITTDEETMQVGTKVDAPDGTYTVDYNGVNYQIVVVSGEITEMTELAKENDLAEENEALKAKIQELTNANTELSKKVEDMQVVEKTVAEMQERIEALVALSGHEPRFEPKPKEEEKPLFANRKEAAKEKANASKSFSLKKL